MSRQHFILIILTGGALIGCANLQTPGYQSDSGGRSSSVYKGLGDYQKLAESGDEGEQTESEDLSTPPPIHSSPGYRPQEAFELIWPVEQVRLNQRYNPNKRKRPHQGIDLGGRRGDPIYASHDGQVVYAGRAFKGYGKMVLIEYDSRWATLYAHLHKFNIKEGQRVRRGDMIGQMGRTGRATGVHLHFELIRDKQPIDPLLFLPQPAHLVSN